MRMKKQIRDVLIKVTTIVLIIVIGLQYSLPYEAFGAVSSKIIYIEDAEDLIELSKNCRLDTWSYGKTVILKNDISLEGSDFIQIPTFGGTFEGNGHVISDFYIESSVSPAGFFGVIQESGKVKDFTLSGNVMPSGEKVYTGGIAGENYGTISSCTFSGTVSGDTDTGGIVGFNGYEGTVSSCRIEGQVNGMDMTGGIAGNNAGMISNCQSVAGVNIEASDPAVTLDDINSAVTLDAAELSDIDTVNIAEDTGGIAGYSSGIIMSCTNSGTVGYPHVGYNVGGIAGRSCGHLAKNSNTGDVFGRKDVGGIVGQIEPQIAVNLSHDIIDNLISQLDELKSLTSETLSDMENVQTDMVSELNELMTLMDNASESAQTLVDIGKSYGSDIGDEVERSGDILSETVSYLADISSALPEISENASNGIGMIEDAFEYLEEASRLGTDSLNDMADAAEDAEKAVSQGRSGLEKIRDGLDLLKSSIEIDDKAEALKAAAEIESGLNEMISAMSDMSSALNKIVKLLEDVYWAEDILHYMKEIKEETDVVISELKSIHSEVLNIQNNIEINWQAIQEGSQSIIDAIDAFSQASSELNEAMELSESGINKIKTGIKTMSLKIKDEEAVKAAVNDIADGFSKLAEAHEKSQAAHETLRKTLTGIKFPSEISESVKIIVTSIKNIRDARKASAEAMIQIAANLKVLADNLTYEEGSVEEGAGLIISGIGDLRNGAEKLKSVNEKLGSGLKNLKAGLEKLNEGIDVNDEAAIKEALSQIHTSIETILECLENMSSILDSMAETMDDMKVWSESMTEALREMSDAFAEFSNGLSKIQNGIKELESAHNINLEDLEQGIKTIEEGLEILAGTAEAVEKAINHGRQGISDMEGAGEAVSKAVEKLANASGAFESSAKGITEILYSAKDMISYLDSVDSVQLPEIDENTETAVKSLYTDLDDIENQLNALLNEGASTTDSLKSDIKKIAEKLTELTDTVVLQLYNMENSDSDIFAEVTDISDEEISKVTYGKTVYCSNSGSVQGDINTGGIAGTVSLEYELDPETDVSSGVSLTQQKEYQLKAILEKCVNNGEIVSKNNCVGGIAGRMDLGLIIDCEAYGSISSEKGGYVGGIAGITGGTVRSSWAKCTLSGGSYIGGIVGDGAEEALRGSSSLVKDCVSLVDITSYIQYAGAIAGKNPGVYENNLFVSDELAGINTISYSNKAEPVDYEELLKLENLPSGFKKFTLKFVADDVTISSRTFNYGDSFDSSVYPDVPKKDGMYGQWDVDNLEQLKFDTVVTAEYKQYTTAVSSEAVREDGRAVFIVEGKFEFSDTVKVQASQQDTQNLASSEDYPFKEEALKEIWSVSIPEDGESSHTIRFLNDSTDGKFTNIYIRVHSDEEIGQWKKVTCNQVGSYLTFDTEGQQIEIAAVFDAGNTAVWAAAGAAAVLMAIIVVLWKKKRGVPHE